jgi:tetratricopeptide (TPR) repeat protein
MEGKDMLSSFLTLPLAFALMLTAVLGVPDADATTADPKGQSERSSGIADVQCPKNAICLAIPDFRVATGRRKTEEMIFATAIPEVIHIALLRYPGIQPVSRGALQRALHETGVSLDQWKPERLFKPDVLRKVGANYVLQGRLYDRRGRVRLSGRVASLKEGDRWRGRTVRGESFPERQIFDAVSSFAAAVVKTLGEAGKLDYHTRTFLMTRFCGASTTTTRRSALYAKELPEALAERSRSVDVVQIKHLGDDKVTCDLLENELELADLAEKNNVDAVVRGRVRLEDDDVSIETEVFIPKKKAWRKMPLITDAGASYLEQKYALLDQFEEFLNAALTETGQWEMALLETPRELAPLLAQAEKSLEAKAIDIASFLLAEALTIDPDSAEAHHLLGLVRYQQRRFRLAVAEQREVIRLNKDLPDAYKALGDALVALREYKEAEGAYQEFHRLAPDSAEAYMALGDVADLLKHYDRAKDYYLKAVELVPEQPEPYEKLANLESGRDEPDEAIKWQQKAHEVDPDNDPIRSRLVNLLIDRGLAHVRSARVRKEFYKDAFEDFDLAIQYDPSPKGESYFRRAYTFARAFRFKKIPSETGYGPAIQDYREALKMNAEEPGSLRSVNKTYLNLQELLLLSDAYKDAIEVGDKYLTQDAEEINRRSNQELIARFHNVVALVLSDKPYDREAARLREQIASGKVKPSGWSFDLLDEGLKKRQPSPTEAQKKAIDKIKGEVETALRGGRKSRK